MQAKANNGNNRLISLPMVTSAVKQLTKDSTMDEFLAVMPPVLNHIMEAKKWQIPNQKNLDQIPNHTLSADICWDCGDVFNRHQYDSLGENILHNGIPNMETAEIIVQKIKRFCNCNLDYLRTPLVYAYFERRIIPKPIMIWFCNNFSYDDFANDLLVEVDEETDYEDDDDEATDYEDN